MENQKKRKVLSKYVTITLCLVTVATVVSASIIYYYRLKSTFKNEITSSLGEIAAQGVITLNKQIQGEINTMRDISNLIGKSKENYNTTDIIKNLLPTVERNQFKRMGIINLDGIAKTTDNYEFDLSESEIFTSGLKGETVISDTLIDNIDGNDVNVYSTPIYRDGVLQGILFATRATDVYKDSLAVSAFNGKGYSYVVKSSGNSLVGSSNENSIKNFDNIMDALLEKDSRNKEAAYSLGEKLKSRKSGYIQFYSNGIEKYMYYSPLEINDWYLLSVVPARVVEEKMKAVIYRTYILAGVFIMVLAVLIFHVFRMQQKGKKVLEKIAYVDPVTGGYSYEKFQKVVGKRLEKEPKDAAIISMDVDKFKYLNDIFGYREGNNAICFIWESLKNITSVNDVFARRTADNFVLFLHYKNEDELFKKLDEMCIQMKKFIVAGKKYYELILSIGIYEIKDGVLNIDSMLDRAQIAKKMVKGKHNEYYMLYDKNVREKEIKNKEIENNMTRALAENEYIVYYQPKYSCENEAIVGAEALVRWIKKDGTMIMPLDFIPLFECNGFITALDKYVFAKVCKDIKKWIEEGIEPVPISVNLSRLHLYNPVFVEEYQEIMNKYNISSKYIRFELTETTIFEDMNVLLEVIDNLHKAGFGVMMDDFGTGYSSLNLLKEVPIDIIKLDKSFIDGIGDEKSEKIIISMIMLARLLDIKVIAEGVENKDQYEFLKSVNCDIIQGYYFSRPLPIEEYEKVLKYS